MMSLPGVGFNIDQNELRQAQELVSHPDLSAARMRKRLLGLMEDGFKKGSGLGHEKEWSLKFLHSPIQLLGSTRGDDGIVERVRWEVNSLIGDSALN